MKKKYREQIRELPLENGGRDLARSIIEASGVLETRPVSKTLNSRTSWTGQMPQTIACLGLAVLIMVFGLVCRAPEAKVSEQMGLNATAMWVQAADGCRSLLGNAHADLMN